MSATSFAVTFGSSDYIYRQLAEECAELTQAALKVVRAHKKETPASVREVYDSVLEEIADVRVMLDIVETAVLNEGACDKITEIYHQKLNSMRERVLPL